MSRIELHDLDDPRIDAYRLMTRSSHHRSSSVFVVEGRRVVSRLLASSLEVVSVLVEEKLVEEFLPQTAPATPVYVAPNGALPQIAGFDFHRGVLACGKVPRFPSLEELTQTWSRRATLAVCPNVQDPENLGTILRTCSALGVDAAVLGRDSAFAFSRRVIRVSMASVFKLPILDTAVLVEDLHRLQNGYDVELVAAVLNADAEPLESVRRTPRTALMFGGEGDGLPPEIIAMADRRVTLSMDRETDSLNVATAAGVFLYHFQRVCR